MKSSSILFLTPFILNLLRYLLIAGTAFIIFYILFSQKFKKNKIQGKKAKQKDLVKKTKLNRLLL